MAWLVVVAQKLGPATRNIESTEKYGKRWQERGFLFVGPSVKCFCSSRHNWINDEIPDIHEFYQLQVYENYEVAEEFVVQALHIIIASLRFASSTGEKETTAGCGYLYSEFKASVGVQ